MFYVNNNLKFICIKELTRLFFELGEDFKDFNDHCLIFFQTELAISVFIISFQCDFNLVRSGFREVVKSVIFSAGGFEFVDIQSVVAILVGFLELLNGIFLDLLQGLRVLEDVLQLLWLLKGS